MSALGGAVVTGAGQGLGKEIAARLARRGYAVHVTDRDEELARATAAEIGNGAWSSGLDVIDHEAAQAVAADTVRRAGSLALWVNNAGILQTGPMWTTDMASWRRLIEVNTIGTLHGVGAALEHMRPAGRGHIINIASLAGLVAVPGEAVYAASKHAVVGLSQSTLADLRASGVKDVHISCICPDGMWTPMLFDRLDDPEAAMSFSSSMLQPSDVADVVEKVVDRPRPVTSVPGWRGGLARLSSAAPTLGLRAIPAIRRFGSFQQGRMRRRSSSSSESERS